MERLRRQNEKLTRDLARTQAALQIMGKHTRSWICSARARRRRAHVIDEAFAELIDAGVDVRRACRLMGRPRSAGTGRGATSNISNCLHWSGWTGTTNAGFTPGAATSHPRTEALRSW